MGGFPLCGDTGTLTPSFLWIFHAFSLGNPVSSQWIREERVRKPHFLMFWLRNDTHYFGSLSIAEKGSHSPMEMQGALGDVVPGWEAISL